MRVLLLLLAALALAGCGFHPRAQLQLPPTLSPLVVVTADPYSPLGLELAATLERAGVAPGVAGSPSAALKITAEEWNTSPLTVDQLARVREYIPRYRVQFAVVDAPGSGLGEPPSIGPSPGYRYRLKRGRSSCRASTPTTSRRAPAARPGRN